MIAVDRIEGDIAVLDVGGRRIDMPLSELPAGIAEGDILVFHKASGNEHDQAERLKRLKKTTQQGPGDFDL